MTNIRYAQEFFLQLAFFFYLPWWDIFSWIWGNTNKWWFAAEFKMPVETVEKYFLSRDYWTALLHRMKRIRERKHGDISCSPVFVQPRDLDFFKRNICICCSPPFYFSLFALGATSLRDQMTCRIFHFLLLGQDSCVSKYVRQELLHDKHSVIQSNPRLTIVCRAEWKCERLSYWISQNSVKSSCWS